jgi:hypothetical protein
VRSSTIPLQAGAQARQWDKFPIGRDFFPIRLDLGRSKGGALSAAQAVDKGARAKVFCFFFSKNKSSVLPIQT